MGKALDANEAGADVSPAEKLLDEAETHLVLRQHQDAAKKALEALKLEPVPGACRIELAAAAVILQAYDELGRWKELRSIFQEAFGSLSAAPIDAVELWARMELAVRRPSEARAVLSEALTATPSGSDVQPPEKVLSAARALVIDVMCKAQGDPQGAVKWLVRDPTLRTESAQARQGENSALVMACGEGWAALVAEAAALAQAAEAAARAAETASARSATGAHVTANGHAHAGADGNGNGNGGGPSAGATAAATRVWAAATAAADSAAALGSGRAPPTQAPISPQVRLAAYLSPRGDGQGRAAAPAPSSGGSGSAAAAAGVAQHLDRKLRHLLSLLQPQVADAMGAARVFWARVVAKTEEDPQSVAIVGTSVAFFLYAAVAERAALKHLTRRWREWVSSGLSDLARATIGSALGR